MDQVVPPRSGSARTGGEDERLRRLHFRLWQLMIAMVTVFGTVWIMLLGVPLLSITAIAVAKHVLVAVFAMNLNIYPMSKPFMKNS